MSGARRKQHGMADCGELRSYLFSRSHWSRQSCYVILTALIVLVPMLAGCRHGSRSEALQAVDYTPQAGGDWGVSTPAKQGLDPRLVAKLYRDADRLETLYGLLVIKDGKLIAEKYFHKGSIDQVSGRQSMTKSVTSALTGIALDRGCLKSADQKMIDFFPEYRDKIADPRKNEITIRELLQMRGGYPWEEREAPYFDRLLMSGNWHWLPHVVDVPLTSDPGTEFKYSNLTSHLVGVIVSRACKTDLESYARENLFSPMHAKVVKWTKDPDNYNWGFFEIYLTARDMGKFGLLYLNHGEYEGRRLISADWVKDSLSRYSTDINFTGWFKSKLGHHFRNLGYGYQWWSADAGDHHFDFAWGHGGQLIVLLPKLNMIVVTTADPIYKLPGEQGWKYEGAIIDVVGKFIESIPNERYVSRAAAES